MRLFVVDCHRFYYYYDYYYYYYYYYHNYCYYRLYTVLYATTASDSTELILAIEGHSCVWECKTELKTV